jgi:TPR repeat protein
MAMNIPEMRRKAEAGSCVAQAGLGACYLYGVDVEIDYQEAFRFLSAAADQGVSRAILNLGHMYAKGLGVPQNVGEAIRLLKAVAGPADSSDAFAARIEHGRIYSRGASVPVESDEAFQWYSAAIALAPADSDSDELREAEAYVAGASGRR